LLSEDAYRVPYDRFLARLRQARKEAGLTRKDVAHLLGKPQSFVSKVETGEWQAEVVELQALASIYRKTQADFQGELPDLERTVFTFRSTAPPEALRHLGLMSYDGILLQPPRRCNIAPAPRRVYSVTQHHKEGPAHGRSAKAARSLHATR